MEDDRRLVGPCLGGSVSHWQGDRSDHVEDDRRLVGPCLGGSVSHWQGDRSDHVEDDRRLVGPCLGGSALFQLQCVVVVEAVADSRAESGIPLTSSRREKFSEIDNVRNLLTVFGRVRFILGKKERVTKTFPD